MIGYEAKIPPEMMVLAHPIDAATPHPKNVRKHRLEKIAQSLQAHGQRYPIIVQEGTNYIVKGNGTWEAAKMLGWQTLAMSFQAMGDDMALSFLYADNRASDLASYDRKKLRDGLAAMVAGPGLLDTLWQVEEFEDLDEEFRGIATLPEKEGGSTDPQQPGAGTDEAPPPAPRPKMREVPMVFSAEQHALFTGWLVVLRERFGVTKAQDVIFEAVRRQVVLETEGPPPITGPVPPEPAPAEVDGQVGMDETVEIPTPKVNPDFPF